MDQLTRIEKLLERIAVALEKHGETKMDWPTFEPCRIHPEDLQGNLTGADPSVATDQWQHLRYDPIRDAWLNKQKSYDTEIKYSTDTTHLRQRFGVDYSMMGDDKTSETCRAKFDNMMNFGVEPHISDDRHLTKEEAHALNRAVKRSTIKVHDGKLEKD